MASSKPSAGRPPRYKYVEDFQDKIDSYFTQCVSMPLPDATTVQVPPGFPRFY